MENASWVTYEKWKIQSKKCAKNEVGVPYWKDDFVFDKCYQMFCTKSSFEENVTELLDLSELTNNGNSSTSENIPVGYIVNYKCQDQRILTGICTESKAPHFTAEWSYPKGACKGRKSCFILPFLLFQFYLILFYFNHNMNTKNNGSNKIFLGIEALLFEFINFGSPSM